MTGLDETFRRVREADPALRFRILAVIAVLLALAILYSSLNGMIRMLEKQRAAKEVEIAELLVLRQRHSEASALWQKSANRQAAVRPDDTPARLVEEIGIKGKSLQVKPLKQDSQGDFSSEAAEIRMDGLTLNEVVNLLFRLEQGGRPVSIPKANLKTRFDDPSRIDLVMTLMLKKSAVQK